MTYVKIDFCSLITLPLRNSWIISFRKKGRIIDTLLSIYFRSGATADTAKSLYLNVKFKHDGARDGAIGAISFLAVSTRAPVVFDEAGTGACSAHQVLATGTEEHNHVNEPDQGESTGEQ